MTIPTRNYAYEYARLEEEVRKLRDRVTIIESRFDVLSEAFQLPDKPKVVTVPAEVPATEAVGSSAASKTGFILTKTPDGCPAASLPESWTPKDVLPHHIQIFIGRAGRPLVRVVVKGRKLSDSEYKDVLSRAVYHCKSNDLYRPALDFLRRSAA